MRKEPDRHGGNPESGAPPQPHLPSAIPDEGELKPVGTRSIREITATPIKVWPLGNPSEFTPEKKYLFAEAIIHAFSVDYNNNTRRAYGEDVRAFFNVPDIGKLTIEDVLSVTSAKAAAYRDEMKARGLANATIQRRMIFVRRFYKFLYRQGLIPNNPLDPIFVPLPKTSEDEITVTPLTEEEVNKILMVPSQSWRGRRNYTIMVFALALGLRRSELGKIRTEQFQRNKESGLLEFSISTKRGKQRRCILRPSVEQALRRWIEIRGAYNGPLFPAARLTGMKAIDPAQIRDNIHSLALKAGIQFREASASDGRKSSRWHVSPHSFRATCIAQMYKAGIGINEIAAFVGHDDPAVTLRYIKRIDANKVKIGATFDHFILGTLGHGNGQHA